MINTTNRSVGDGWNYGWVTSRMEPSAFPIPISDKVENRVHHARQAFRGRFRRQL
jgi:hypothetical protein